MIEGKMNSLTVHFLNRDFSEMFMQPAGLMVTVERMSWAAVGGPDRCRLSCAGRAAALWELVELLRCPVEIRDEKQDLVWWGYVDAASVQSGKLRSTVSLAEMANRVQVVYSHLLPGLGLMGSRILTTAVQDDESVTTYGRKELQYPVGGMNAEQANALRDKLLLARKWPVPRVDVLDQEDPGSEQPEQGTGELECVGWWHILDWKFYAQAAGREINEVGGVQTWVGAQVADTKVAQSLQLLGSLSWQAERVYLKIKTIGAPADDLIVELCSDNAGVPGGVLATGILPGPMIGGSTNLKLFDIAFAAKTTVTPGVPYWLQIRRSGAIDGMNYYEVDLSSPGVYSRGTLRIWNGGAWVADIPDSDLWFRLHGSQETTEQIRILLGYQIFFTAVDIETASGVYSCQYRRGDHKFRTEIESLLAAGTLAGRRLLATVSPERRVRIYAEPEPGAMDWSLMRNGEILDEFDRPVSPQRGVWGVWVRLRDLVPGSADVTKLADFSRLFVDGSEWVRGKGLRILQRK